MIPGIAAAAVWATAEPLVGRALGVAWYSDARLLGRTLTKGRLWRPLGIAVHLANGATFGAVFARLGGRGWKQGVLAAEAESALLWPGMAVIDRIHPDRRRAEWPPLLFNGRVFAYEMVVHAIFGAVLGTLLSEAD
ncbi:hypothetical protein BH18ACT14_BH18ACT14_05620 [soil metagenome]